MYGNRRSDGVDGGTSFCRYYRFVLGKGTALRRIVLIRARNMAAAECICRASVMTTDERIRTVSPVSVSGLSCGGRRINFDMAEW